MTDESDDVEFNLEAETFTLHASEKVSTGEFESGTVSQTIEGSIEGVNLTDEIPPEVREVLYERQRALQDVVVAIAERRREEAQEDADDDRVHEVE